MKNKFRLSDESGDRKYFTIVPNYIVNHSTPYEQAIYLYMKRKAGEDGTCWSSAQEIANRLGISRNTVAKYRTKLVKRKWVEEVGMKGKTKPTIEYKIVDLWKLNSEFYSKKDSSTVEQSQKIVQPVNLDSSTVGHKEEPSKEEPITVSNLQVADKTINEFISIFKRNNPSYKRLFSNTTQRAAAYRFIEKYKDKAIPTAEFAVSISGKPYAPVIITPYDLEKNIGKLIAYYQKENTKVEKNRSKVAIVQ